MLVVDRIPEPVPEFVLGIVVRTVTVDPRALDEWQRHPKFRGVCCGLAPERLAGLAELEKRDLTLDVSGGVGWLARVVESFPGLRVVVDDVGSAPSLPDGVCGKLTRTVGGMLARFGPKRLMFGSDWPSRLPEITWKASLAAFTQSIGAQPIEIREQILGGTAASFYRI